MALIRAVCAGALALMSAAVPRYAGCSLPRWRGGLSPRWRGELARCRTGGSSRREFPGASSRREVRIAVSLSVGASTWVLASVVVAASTCVVTVRETMRRLCSGPTRRRWSHTPPGPPGVLEPVSPSGSPRRPLFVWLVRAAERTDGESPGTSARCSARSGGPLRLRIPSAAGFGSVARTPGESISTAAALDF